MIFFDLDDTLLDHKYAQDQALLVAHQQFFGNVKEADFLAFYQQLNIKCWEKYAQNEITKEVLNATRFGETIAHFNIDLPYQDFENTFFKHYALNWKWIDGAKDAFLDIAEKMPVGIITNGFLSQQNAKFAKFPEIKAACTHILISEECGFMKPHEGIFRYAEKISGCLPHQLTIIGDSWSSDIAGAINAGWNAYWFKGNRQKEIPKNVQVFEDWNDWEVKSEK